MARDDTNPPDWSALIPVLPAAGPKGAALTAALRDLVRSGRLPKGAKLPPSRDLAVRLGLSRGLIVAAYDQLLAEGFAEARVGAGTFVSADLPQTPTADSWPDEVAPSGPEILPAQAGRLGMGMADARSLGLLRRLIGQSLLRPDPHLSYGDPRGSAALRAEVAAYLQGARAVRVHPDQIVLTAGAQGAIDLTLRAALSPGDAVWVEDPAYPSALAAIRGGGFCPIGVPVDAQGMQVAEGVRAAPGARAAYVTPSHQFPLGVVMSMPRRLALLDWAAAAGAWVIEDDYDSEFRYAGAPLAALQGMDGGGRVIYVGTFSKVLMPGLRMGYAVVPLALLPRVLELRDRSDRYPPTLIDAALAAFLREGHFARHLRRARRRAEAARDALVAGLAGGPLQAVAPDQGLHLVATVPGLTEAQAIALAARAGLQARSLSRTYLTAPPREGLVIGFSGSDPVALGRVAAGVGRQ